MVVGVVSAVDRAVSLYIADIKQAIVKPGVHTLVNLFR